MEGYLQGLRNKAAGNSATPSRAPLAGAMIAKVMAPTCVKPSGAVTHWIGQATAKKVPERSAANLGPEFVSNISGVAIIKQPTWHRPETHQRHIRAKSSYEGAARCLNAPASAVATHLTLPSLKVGAES
ncbi:hypothetical protein JMJ56_30910 [Belnapia sp. T18]|uniref:Uncharacterized protein n=1 Tax=Belnapia arida TaxID=2804533 RepID=A0ABS1UCG9_9PROT|nr:hypothetical protein [Belnapia arida]